MRLVPSLSLETAGSPMFTQPPNSGGLAGLVAFGAVLAVPSVRASWEAFINFRPLWTPLAAFLGAAAFVFVVDVLLAAFASWATYHLLGFIAWASYTVGELFEKPAPPSEAFKQYRDLNKQLAVLEDHLTARDGGLPAIYQRLYDQIAAHREELGLARDASVLKQTEARVRDIRANQPARTSAEAYASMPQASLSAAEAEDGQK